MAVGVSVLHAHFADHEQAIVDAQAHATFVAAQARQAQAQAHHDAEARANHEQRLAWQKTHPQEYARQLAQRREAAAAAERQANAERAAEARKQQRDAEAAERQRVAAENQPKVDELATADSEITAEKISGNPSKYVDSVVKLKCKVVNVVNDVGANALCGSVNDDTSEFSAMLVLTGDSVSSYDANQVVMFVGTVQEPTEGTNAMGGTMRFPIVRVDYAL